MKTVDLAWHSDWCIRWDVNARNVRVSFRRGMAAESMAYEAGLP